MKWIYKDHTITVNIKGDFVFKHEDKFYYAETLKNAQLIIDALCKNITVNKYEIVAELTKIETKFNSIINSLSLKFPKIEEFRKYIDSLIEKYENK